MYERLGAFMGALLGGGLCFALPCGCRRRKGEAAKLELSLAAACPWRVDAQCYLRLVRDRQTP